MQPRTRSTGRIAVDREPQVIVAQQRGTNPADLAAPIPLVDSIETALDRKPDEVSADSGFAGEANLAALEARAVVAYRAPGRAQHGVGHEAGARICKDRPWMTAMAEKIKTAGRESPDRFRKPVVEPVFGQIKQARGFRRFLLRGLVKVRGAWALICTAHDLLKLAKAKAA